jgi:hypothetical protein
MARPWLHGVHSQSLKWQMPNFKPFTYLQFDYLLFLYQMPFYTIDTQAPAAWLTLHSTGQGHLLSSCCRQARFRTISSREADFLPEHMLGSIRPAFGAECVVNQVAISLHCLESPV